jgi:hypothetical protein
MSEPGFAFTHGFSVGDDILKAIGLTVVCQSHVETMLSVSIHEVAELEYQKGSAVTAGMSFKSLCAALSSLVLQVLDQNDERYNRFTKLMGKLQHFEEFRNQVAHSNWGHGEGFQSGRSTRIKTTARQSVGVKHQWEEVDIATISAEIETASLAKAHLSILVAEVAGKPIQEIDLTSS